MVFVQVESFVSCCFQDFLLVSPFSIFPMGVHLWISLCLSHLEFAKILDVYFPINLGSFNNYFFKYFSASLLLSPSFWYSHYMYVGVLNGVLYFSSFLIIYFLFFFFNLHNLYPSI